MDLHSSSAGSEEAVVSSVNLDHNAMQCRYVASLASLEQSQAWPRAQSYSSPLFAPRKRDMRPIPAGKHQVTNGRRDGCRRCRGNQAAT